LFSDCSRDHRCLHSFPTRRSSDLTPCAAAVRTRAMTPRRLLLVLALALPAMLLATLPLRLALELPGIAHWGLAARSASGSIWNGRLEGASVRDMALGDASVRLSPLPLLLGTTAARLSAPGVDARLLHGRRRGVDRLEGRLTLPPSSLAAGIPLQLQASSLQVL